MSQAVGPNNSADYCISYDTCKVVTYIISALAAIVAITAFFFILAKYGHQVGPINALTTVIETKWGAFALGASLITIIIAIGACCSLHPECTPYDDEEPTTPYREIQKEYVSDDDSKTDDEPEVSNSDSEEDRDTEFLKQQSAEGYHASVLGATDLFSTTPLQGNHNNLDREEWGRFADLFGNP